MRGLEGQCEFKGAKMTEFVRDRSDRELCKQKLLWGRRDIVDTISIAQ